MKKKKLPWPFLMLIDIVLTGVALCVFALFHHVLPNRMKSGTEGLIYTGPAVTKPAASAEEPTVSPALTKAASTQDPAATPTIAPTASAENPAATPTSAPTASAGHSATDPEITPSPSPEPAKTPDDFSASFPDRFTDGEVIETETSYQSKNISVTTTKVTGNRLTYYVQDIYIRDIQYLKTAFAEDTYGKSISEWPLSIAVRNNAIASINGDYYGIHNNGVVIRNGYVYRTAVDPSAELCVIYFDGTMEVIPASFVSVDELIENGCYQSFSFGPGLLNADGTAIKKFYSKIAVQNPRSAIGYYEPGHYCFVSVDGRNENGSSGATLVRLAQIMEELGCKAAYNLDGGKSSAMTFQDALVNTPCDGGRKDTDIILISE